MLRRRLHRLSLGFESKRWMLAAVALSGLVTFGSHLIFPALLIQITNTFQITNTSAGIVFTLIAVVNGSLQYPSGALGDSFGGQVVLLGGLLVFLTGVGLVMLPGPFWLFVLGALLLGVGTGLVGTVRYTVASTAYPQRTDFAFGFVSAGANLGSVALPPLAVTIALWLDWRLSFGILLPFALAAAVPLLFSDAPNKTTPKSKTSGPLMVMSSFHSWLRDGRFLSSLVLLSTMTFVYYGVTSFFPTYLVYQKSMTQATASAYYSVFLFSGVVMTIVSGYLGDRIGSMRVLLTLVVVTALALFSLPVVTRRPTLLFVALMLGSQMGIWPVCQSYVMTVFPTHMKGGSLGLFRTVFLTVGAGGSTTVGAFVDANRFDEAFVFLGILTVAALGVGLHLTRSKY